MEIPIEPYNPNWKIEFDEIRKVYQKQLEGLQLDIEHVGSTIQVDWKKNDSSISKGRIRY